MRYDGTDDATSAGLFARLLARLSGTASPARPMRRGYRFRGPRFGAAYESLEGRVLLSAGSIDEPPAEETPPADSGPTEGDAPEGDGTDGGTVDGGADAPPSDGQDPATQPAAGPTDSDESAVLPPPATDAAPPSGDGGATTGDGASGPADPGNAAPRNETDDPAGTDGSGDGDAALDASFGDGDGLAAEDGSGLTDLPDAGLGVAADARGRFARVLSVEPRGGDADAGLVGLRSDDPSERRSGRDSNDGTDRAAEAALALAIALADADDFHATAIGLVDWAAISGGTANRGDGDAAVDGSEAGGQASWNFAESGIGIIPFFAGPTATDVIGRIIAAGLTADAGAELDLALSVLLGWPDPRID